MKTIFQYQGKAYSYIVVDSEVITFRLDQKDHECEIVLDEEMEKQLEVEFAAYEATLNEEEMKIWRGE